MTDAHHAAAMRLRTLPPPTARPRQPTIIRPAERDKLLAHHTAGGLLITETLGRADVTLPRDLVQRLAQHLQRERNLIRNVLGVLP